MEFDNEFILEIQKCFVEEASELLEKTESCYLELERNPKNPSILEEIFRCVHTIKGGAAGVGFDGLSSFSHKIENLLVKLKNYEIAVNTNIVNILLNCNDRLNSYIQKLNDDNTAVIETQDLVLSIENALTAPPSEDTNPNNLQEETVISTEEVIEAPKKRIGEILIEQGLVEPEEVEKALAIQNDKKQETSKKEETFIKLPLSKIDNMLNYFGEQVILQSVLEYSRNDLNNNKNLIDKTILQLNKITYDLQQTAISLRMLNLKNLFNRAQRIIRDTSIKVSKKINFETIGEETELDKTILDELSGPLSHILRNAVDHGIEDEATRIKNKKSRSGKITLRAFHKGGFFYMEIIDDGKGLDREKIKLKGIKKGLLKSNQNIDDNLIFQLIMESGFSTHDKATDISGRGVGLDVVKTAIEKLHGTINITSETNKGSCFTLKLPLTLAIFNGFIVKINEKKYIFPNSEIKEVCHINLNKARRINKKEWFLEVKENVIPLIDVKKLLLNKSESDKKEGKEVMLIVNCNGQDIALMVDDIIGQQKIVLKKLGKEVENIPGISGGTILGDGKVSLIVDVNELVNLHQQTL